MTRITRRDVLVGGVAAGMTAVVTTPGRAARAEAGAPRGQTAGATAMARTPLESRVLDAIDPDAVLGCVQDLVRAPSIFPRERECALVLAEYLREAGLSVETPDVEPERPNVIGTLRGSGDGPHLLIEGHTDTVALGDESQWTVDPFGGVIQEGRLFGRGAMDMKGGLGAAVMAAKAVVDAGVRLRGTLTVAGLIDEENLMIGAKHFVSSGRAQGIDSAITVEPTFSMGIGTAFCGRTRAEITVHGAPGHIGVDPESPFGLNAIEAAAPLIQRISSAPPPHAEHPIYKRTHWQVVSIGGGDPNEATIPAMCRIRVDARTVPGHAAAEIWRHMATLIAELDTPEHPLRAEINLVEGYDTESWETPLDAAVVQALDRAYGKALGQVPRHNVPPELPPGSGYPLKVSTDLHHIAPLGVACANTGPRGAGAHGVDEYVRTDEIINVTQVLALTILDYLGVEDA